MAQITILPVRVYTFADFPVGTRVIITDHSNGSGLPFTAEVIANSYGAPLCKVISRHDERDGHPIPHRASLYGLPLTTPLWWITEGLLSADEGSLEIIGQAAAPRITLLCAGCGAANDYAEPNTTDNRHVCYACRTGGEAWRWAGLLR